VNKHRSLPTQMMGEPMHIVPYDAEIPS
jgi:hypothetical protein